MEKIEMRDVVVLLPGITGSVLQKDGKDLWGLSLQSLWNALPRPNKAIQQLKFGNDDPAKDELGDGIRAISLMQGIHLIPGFWKIDGYGGISKMIQDGFDLIPGDLRSEEPANYFEFAYDWRRDNRYTADLLQRLLESHLSKWQSKGRKDAKVILLAHSMGGLVARYYLEVLGGWKHCKALITFGTPFRGSIKSLGYLANGYRNFLVDLTDVLRSFSSAYQLLPIYEAVKSGANYHRVAETADIPNIDSERAKDALRFHREIEDAVIENSKLEEYRKGYKTIPIVGTRQRTLQSAELFQGRLTISEKLPAVVPSALNDGDGTVPRVSQIPIELSQDYRDTFFAERHASLQNNNHALSQIYEQLKHMQLPDLGAIRGPEISIEAAEKPALSVDLEDLYFESELVIIRTELINTNDNSGTPSGKIESLSPEGGSKQIQFEREQDAWVANTRGLRPGSYRLTVMTDRSGPDSPSPVHDIFEVAPQI